MLIFDRIVYRSGSTRKVMAIVQFILRGYKCCIQLQQPMPKLHLYSAANHQEDLHSSDRGRKPRIGHSIQSKHIPHPTSIMVYQQTRDQQLILESPASLNPRSLRLCLLLDAACVPTGILENLGESENGLACRAYGRGDIYICPPLN